MKSNLVHMMTVAALAILVSGCNSGGSGSNSDSTSGPQIIAQIQDDGSHIHFSNSHLSVTNSVGQEILSVDDVADYQTGFGLIAYRTLAGRGVVLNAVGRVLVSGSNVVDVGASSRYAFFRSFDGKGQIVNEEGKVIRQLESAQKVLLVPYAEDVGYLNYDGTGELIDARETSIRTFTKQRDLYLTNDIAVAVNPDQSIDLIDREGATKEKLTGCATLGVWDGGVDCLTDQGKDLSFFSSGVQLTMNDDVKLSKVAVSNQFLGHIEQDGFGHLLAGVDHEIYFTDGVDLEVSNYFGAYRTKKGAGAIVAPNGSPILKVDTGLADVEVSEAYAAYKMTDGSGGIYERDGHLLVQHAAMADVKVSAHFAAYLLKSGEAQLFRENGTSLAAVMAVADVQLSDNWAAYRTPEGNGALYDSLGTLRASFTANLADLRVLGDHEANLNVNQTLEIRNVNAEASVAPRTIQGVKSFTLNQDGVSYEDSSGNWKWLSY